MFPRLALVVAVVSCVWPWNVAKTLAQGQPKVVVLVAPEAAPRPGFSQVLRIQIAGLATLVDTGELASGGTRSERIENALRAGARADAVAAVWFEGPFVRTDGEGELVVYVVGRRQNRAIVDILRVPATPSAATRDAVVDRSLALKVREVLWELTRGADVLTAFHVAETSEPVVTAELNAGALLKTASGSLQAEPGGRFGAGVRIGWTDLELLVIARVHWIADDRTRASAGSVTIGEISPALEATAYWIVNHVRIGARVGFQLRMLRATGTTAAGVSGDANDTLPSITVGPAFGFRLRDWLELGLSLDADLTFRRQIYAVDHQEIADSGRLRGAACISLSTIF